MGFAYAIDPATGDLLLDDDGQPVTTTDPKTSNIFVDMTTQRSIDKIDLLFMVDNSGSMLDKQAMLKLAVPQLLGRLINPMCKNGAGASAASNGGVCTNSASGVGR